MLAGILICVLAAGAYRFTAVYQNKEKCELGRPLFVLVPWSAVMIEHALHRLGMDVAWDWIHVTHNCFVRGPRLDELGLNCWGDATHDVCLFGAKL